LPGNGDRKKPSSIDMTGLLEQESPAKNLGAGEVAVGKEKSFGTQKEGLKHNNESTTG